MKLNRYRQAQLGYVRAETQRYLGGFNEAGFLSRSRREHDYHGGRLDAAERLIDIVSDAAAVENALGKTDIRALKRDALPAILDTEARHLQDKDLIARMESVVSIL
jgi:hypothetical protein